MLVAGAESSTLQNLGSIGEFATAVIAAVAAVIAFWQIRSGRSATKEARVFAYAERLNRPDLIPILVEARTFWEYGQGGQEEAGLQQWEDMDAEARHRVMFPLNVLEEIGRAYADKIVDRDLARKYIRPAAEVYFKEANWFIEYQRGLYVERQLPGVPYDQWERMLWGFEHPPLSTQLLAGIPGTTAWREMRGFSGL